MKALLFGSALLAVTTSNIALAGDLAIDVSGTVTSLNAPMPLPFDGVQVGDAVSVHYSLHLPADLSVSGESTYQLDHAASRVVIGAVISPVSNTPVVGGSPAVKLIDGTTDGLFAQMRLPGDNAWMSTAINDPTGALIADVDILNMQGHTAGPFTTNQGGSFLLSFQGLEISVQVNQVYFGPEGFPAYGSYCFGTSAACPCANGGALGEGCDNSTGKGARLSVYGGASLSSDTLSFVSIQHPPGVPGLLLTGTNWTNGGAGFPIADGLLCVGGTTERLGVVFSDAVGTCTWGPGLLSQTSAVAGQQRYFQAWYRDVNSSPCSGAFNFSNGIVTWVSL